jgi:hypothetical protein
MPIAMDPKSLSYFFILNEETDKIIDDLNTIYL